MSDKLKHDSKQSYRIQLNMLYNYMLLNTLILCLATEVDGKSSEVLLIVQIGMGFFLLVFISTKLFRVSIQVDVFL